NSETLIKIIDKLPHVVFLKDSKHRFLLANKACLALLNAKGEDVIGKTDDSFFTPDYVQYAHKLENSILRNGENKIIREERFTNLLGKEQIMKTTRVPLYIPEMHEVGVLAIAVNMTKEKELEESIRYKNTELEVQKKEIEEKRKNAEDLYHKVKTGLQFSKVFQDTILPNPTTLKRLLPDSFVLYNPKPITNGDFYWIKEKDGFVYMATIDCSAFDAGGTFIAMLCYDILSQILQANNKPMPAKILFELNEGLKTSLEQCIDLSKMKERVYINLCVLNNEEKIIEHSGSGTSMVIANKGTFFVFEPANEKTGLPFDENTHEFIDSQIRIEKGDSIYLMTDGFAHQKTKMNGTKQTFGYERLKDLIIEISDFSMEKQHALLCNILKDFKGEEEQSHDILILGVRV
ncbi:MAG TPA: PAS domain S-box protein, partial [Cytophagaceae bacterium]|nr:PAS domain S-box protein [Cytophagaceae bacterium]